MRYVFQFLIPALIFLLVVMAVTRRRRSSGPHDDSGTGTYLVLLVIGAVVAVAVLFGIQVYLGGQG